MAESLLSAFSGYKPYSTVSFNDVAVATPLLGDEHEEFQDRRTTGSGHHCARSHGGQR
jgi:hypothetical protein